MVSSKNKVKGFTLVELLIVIVVIAILAAISIVAYNGVTLKARDDKRSSDARNVLSAISSYHADQGEWLDATNATSKLGTFNTIKVPSDVLSRVTADEPSGASAAEKDRIQVKTCGTPVSGVEIVTWSEEKNAKRDPIKAGNC